MIAPRSNPWTEFGLQIRLLYVTAPVVNGRGGFLLEKWDMQRKRVLLSNEYGDRVFGVTAS